MEEEIAHRIFPLLFVGGKAQGVREHYKKSSKMCP